MARDAAHPPTSSPLDRRASGCGWPLIAIFFSVRSGPDQAAAEGIGCSSGVCSRLERQQPPLGGEDPRRLEVATKMRGGDDPVARDDDRNGVMCRWQWPTRPRTATGDMRDVEVAARSPRRGSRTMPAIRAVGKWCPRERAEERTLSARRRNTPGAVHGRDAARTFRFAGFPSPNRQRRLPRPLPRRRCRQSGCGAKAVPRCRCQRRRPSTVKGGEELDRTNGGTSLIIRSPPNFPCVCLAMTRGTI